MTRNKHQHTNGVSSSSTTATDGGDEKSKSSSSEKNKSSSSGSEIIQKLPTKIDTTRKDLRNGLQIPSDVFSWTIEHVQIWLKFKKFNDEILQSFMQEKIDGLSLYYLTVNDYLKLDDNHLNIVRLGDLIHLKHELSVLFKDLTPPSGCVGNFQAVNPTVIPTVADILHSPTSPIRPLSKDDTHIITNTGSLSPFPQMIRHASSPSSLAHSIPFVPSQLESILPPSLPQIIKQLIPSEIKMMSEKEKEEWSSMITKVTVSMFYAMFAIFCTSVTMVHVHERVPKDYPPLPDIILDNLPLIPSAFAISEIICLVLGLIVFFVLVIHKHRGIIFRRVLVIIASVFLIRCITMFITSLSVPGQHLTHECMRTRGMTTTFEEKMKRALEITFGFGMSIMNVKTCGDYMFSGHMSMITILNYTINEYTPKHWKGLHIITWVLNCFGAFFVLAAHEHYSIDVFIGFFISSRLFVYYHDTANMRHILNLHNIETTAYIPLFDYMEDTVDGVVKNEFIISVGEKDHRHRPLHSIDTQTLHTLQQEQLHQHPIPTSTTMQH